MSYAESMSWLEYLAHSIELETEFYPALMGKDIKKEIIKILKGDKGIFATILLREYQFADLALCQAHPDHEDNVACMYDIATAKLIPYIVGNGPGTRIGGSVQ